LASDHIPRQTTTDELISGAERLKQRLGRHLDAIEAGSSDAVDDAASVLRTLLTPGRGDNVIRRLYRQASVTNPSMCVSEMATTTGGDVALSVCGLPVLPTEQEPSKASPMGNWVDIDRWTQMTALVLKGGNPRRVNSWSDVINLYANTFGSHMSTSIPTVLDQTARVYSNRMNLGHYLIHCAGVIGEDALGQVLGEIRGSKVVLPSRRRLGPVVHLIIRNTAGNFDVQVGYVGIDAPAGAVTELATFHLANTYIRFDLLQIEGGRAIPRLSHAEEQPDWWPAP
jgi:hypothetical protein